MDDDRNQYHHRFMGVDNEIYAGGESSDEDAVNDVSHQRSKTSGVKTSPSDGTTSDDSDRSENNYFDKTELRRRRLNNSERNIYGVFAESDDESYNKKKRKRRDTTSTKNRKTTTAPMFVKSQSTNETKSNNVDTNEPAIDANVESSSVKFESNEEQRKQEEANQKFINLLNAGMQKRPIKRSTQFTKSENNAHESDHTKNDDNDYYANTVQPAFGLGFSKQQTHEDPDTLQPTFGLGFSKQQIYEDSERGQTPLFGLGFSKPKREEEPETAHATFGLGFSKQQRHEDSDYNEIHNQNLHSNTSTIDSLPNKFGMKKATMKSPQRKDWNVGKWEKHTKGIGMRLLSKMGFQGSGGLGKRQEIQTLVNDRPIEVKVRPVNLGLGFGNFKESTSVKSDSNKESKDKSKAKFSIRESQLTSAIPSNAELLEEKPWRKGSKKSDQPKKKRVIIGYKELLEQQQTRESEFSSMKIIDMRGPSSSSTSEALDGTKSEETIPLGQELLHNLSILLSSYETKLLLASQYVSSTEQKVLRLQSDFEGIEKRKQQISDQMEKLRRIQETLNEMGMIITNADLNGDDNNDLVSDIIEKLQETATYYSIDEQKASEFSSTIVPALLDPIMTRWLESWNPLRDSLAKSLKIARSVLFLRDDGRNRLKSSIAYQGSIDFAKLRRSLLMRHLIPRIVNALESSRWDPVKDTEIATSLFESIYELIKTEIPKIELISKDEEKADQSLSVLGALEEEENDPNRLSHVFRIEIVHKAVYKKLMTFVSHWKPCLASPADAGNQLRRIIGDSVDGWVIPWIPHLSGDRALTTQLVAECKRKVKISLQYLHKSIPSERQYYAEFLSAAFLLLQSWRGIFKQESLYDMVSENIVDRLARYATSLVSSKHVFQQEKSSFKWTDLDILYKFHSCRLLTNIEFLSIVEAEILTPWVAVVYQYLSDNGSNPNALIEVARVYVEWKKHIMEATPFRNDFSTGKATDDNYESSTSLLQQDTRICACFYSVAMIMKAAKTAPQKTLDSRIPSRNVSFRVVVALRKKIAAQLAENDLIRMNALGGVHDNILRAGEIAARIRLNQNGTRSSIPTFREVVAEFARDKDILFQPRLGANSTKDGKQIFLFGSVPVYLDEDVVFALRDGQWVGMSLETLAKMEEMK